MSFCAKCGAQLADGSVFCPSCGARQDGAAAQSANQQGSVSRGSAGQNRLHCPYCRSYNLNATTESSTGAALTTGHGNMAVTTVSNTHRDFWICGDCGRKFRNPHSMDEEIKKNRQSSTVCRVFGLLFLVFVIMFVVSALGGGFGVFIGFFAIPSTLIATIVFLYFSDNHKKKAMKLEEEKAALLRNCYN